MSSETETKTPYFNDVVENLAKMGFPYEALVKRGAKGVEEILKDPTLGWHDLDNEVDIPAEELDAMPQIAPGTTVEVEDYPTTLAAETRFTYGYDGWDQGLGLYRTKDTPEMIDLSVARAMASIDAQTNYDAPQDPVSIAFVGPSGSGKSAMLDALMRLRVLASSQTDNEKKFEEADPFSPLLDYLAPARANLLSPITPEYDYRARRVGGAILEVLEKEGLGNLLSEKISAVGSDRDRLRVGEYKYLFNQVPAGLMTYQRMISNPIQDLTIGTRTRDELACISTGIFRAAARRDDCHVLSAAYAGGNARWDENYYCGLRGGPDGNRRLITFVFDALPKRRLARAFRRARERMLWLPTTHVLGSSVVETLRNAYTHSDVVFYVNTDGSYPYIQRLEKGQLPLPIRENDNNTVRLREVLAGRAEERMAKAGNKPRVTDDAVRAAAEDARKRQQG